MFYKNKMMRMFTILLVAFVTLILAGCELEINGPYKPAIDSLVAQMPTEIENDIEWPELPAEYLGKYTARFDSTRTDVIDNDGFVNRGYEDVDVVIKVGVVDVADDSYYSVNLTVTVKALDVNAFFDNIKLQLDASIPSSTDHDLTLPTFPNLNINLTYQSDNEVVLNNVGEITPTEADVDVHLTVTLTFRNETRTYIYLVTVQKDTGDGGEDPVTDGQLTVNVINVGQGDAILVQLPNDQVLMIDAGKGLYGGEGSDVTIRNYLNTLGIDKIDYLLISHPHSDHYEWVPMLLNNYQVDNVYFSAKTRTTTQYLDIVRAISNKGLTIQVPQPGDFIFNFTNLSLLTITNKAVSDDNASSLMVKLTYKENTFMFAGDGGFEGSDEAEDRALASGLNLHADVLKVGHHGSGGSSGTEFLAAVGATYGLLTTVYGSATGHPHETAMLRLKAAHVDLYQTRDLGNIIVICDGLNYQFNSLKDGVLTENVAPSDPWRL